MESPIDPVALIRDEHKHLTPHLALLEGAAAAMARVADRGTRPLPGVRAARERSRGRHQDDELPPQSDQGQGRGIGRLSESMWQGRRVNPSENAEMARSLTGSRRCSRTNSLKTKRLLSILSG